MTTVTQLPGQLWPPCVDDIQHERLVRLAELQNVFQWEERPDQHPYLAEHSYFSYYY